VLYAAYYETMLLDLENDGDTNAAIEGAVTDACPSAPHL
jgi:hypothetical protein